MRPSCRRRPESSAARVPPVPHAEVNGQRLYYEVHGEGEPLVLVMGLGGDLLAWARQIPEWSTRYRLIAIENRDVGRSSYADGPYEIADMAADTLAVVDELGIDTFHLLGVSMGGAISQDPRAVCARAGADPDPVRHLGRQRPLRRGAVRDPRPPVRPDVDRGAGRLPDAPDDVRAGSTRTPAAVAWLRGVLSNPNPQKSEGFVRQLDACGRPTCATGSGSSPCRCT